MNWIEGVITLLFGVFFGFALGAKWGGWIVRVELEGKPYRKLKAERDCYERILITASKRLAAKDFSEARQAETKEDDVLDSDLIL